MSAMPCMHEVLFGSSYRRDAGNQRIARTFPGQRRRTVIVRCRMGMRMTDTMKRVYRKQRKAIYCQAARLGCSLFACLCRLCDHFACNQRAEMEVGSDRRRKVGKPCRSSLVASTNQASILQYRSIGPRSFWQANLTRLP